MTQLEEFGRERLIDLLKESNTRDMQARIFHGYKALIGEHGSDKDKTYMALEKVGEEVEVTQAQRLGESVIGRFEYRNHEYTIDQTVDLIRDAADPRQHKATEEAGELLHDVVKYIAKDKYSLESMYPDAIYNYRPNAALEKYIKWLEGELWPGVWSDIMNYPFTNTDDERGDVKKHLMLGFAPGSGKSIITGALDALYGSASVIMPARGRFSFDAGTWNKQVADKFLVITDDDNEDAPVSEDFIKNFMNEKQGNVTASSGERGVMTFKGSSVIATNNEEEFYSKPQVSKRIILLRLDNSMPKFTRKELGELHDLDPADIMAHVGKPTRRLIEASYRNKWTETQEEQYKDIKEYIVSNGGASNKTLVQVFGAEAMRRFKRNQSKPKNFTADGATMYGYPAEMFAEDVKNAVYGSTSLPVQANFDEFEIRMMTGITDTKNVGTVKTSFSRFADNIKASADTPKQEQPLLAFFTGKDATLDSIDGATGVVIDVDNSKFKSLDEIELPYDYLAYETSSSTPDKLRYRILIPGIESTDDDNYKANAQAIAKQLGDNVDPSGFSISHRFYVGGTNITINYKRPMVGLPHSDKTGLLERVKTAEPGTRNNITYWALKRAQEDNDEDLAAEILSVAQIEPEEVERFSKRWDAGKL